MKTRVHKADTRGLANHGWLKSFHSFSFAHYYNPEKMGFGLLRVLNDDFVAGGGGFGTHPHDNMEIISIPLSGALKHKDSTGNEFVVRTGDIQIMSAGTGVYHSEMNASANETVNFLQLWILPKVKNIAPRYQQKNFSLSANKNAFVTVVSPDENAGSVWINQDAYLSLGELDADLNLNYNINKTDNGLYVFVLEGQVEIAGEQLNKRDAIGIEGTSSVQIKTKEASKLLFIEVPMKM